MRIQQQLIYRLPICKHHGRRAFGLCALFLSLATAQTPQQAEQFARARQLAAEGRFADAAPIYAELVKSAPGNPGLMLNYGMALHMAGRDSEAVDALAGVLKVQPSAYPALVMTGVSYMRLGEPARAIVPLGKAAGLKPDDLEVRRMLADAQLLLGRNESAAANLKRIAAAAPQDPRSWYALGRSYELLAQKAYEDLVKAAPASAYALVLAGEARLRQKRYTSAFGLFREAAAKPPAPAGLYAGLAEVYDKTGHEDWAASERAKEKQSAAPALQAAKQMKGSAGLFWQARAYNAMALDAFRKLASLPPSPELFEVVAELQRNQGQFAESLQSWNEALKLTPGDRRLRREIAATVYLSRDYRKAEPLLREELARDAPSPELNFMLGDTLLNLQKPAEALPFLLKAVQTEPKYLPAQSALARSYGQTGEPEKALPHLEASLPIDTDGALHYQLARAYQALGKSEEARKLLARYQELQRESQGGEEGEITAPAP